MTIQNDDRKTTPVVTDGETGIFYYDFPIFFGEDGQKGLEVRYENELNYDVVSPTEYIVLPNTENTGGYVQFEQVPIAGKNLIIVGKTQVDQQLNITNHGKFQAEAIETNFDKIVAIMQEWSFRLSEEERQRIANDSATIQQYITAHNELKAYLEYRFDMRWQEMSDYLDSLLPMFFCIMQKELNAFVYSDEGIQNILDQIGDYDKFVTMVVGETGVITAEILIDKLNLNDKANVDDVYEKTETYNKPEIDSSLTLKSDKSDTFTKSEVNILVSLKANTTYVDNAVGAISTDASKQYATLALANADIANIALNKNIFVSEAVNGGYWYKATAGATSLTKSAYDPLTQAKNYAKSYTDSISTIINDGWAPNWIASVEVDKDGLIISYTKTDGTRVDDSTSESDAFISYLESRFESMSDPFAPSWIVSVDTDSNGNVISFVRNNGTRVDQNTNQNIGSLTRSQQAIKKLSQAVLNAQSKPKTLDETVTISAPQSTAIAGYAKAWTYFTNPEFFRAFGGNVYYPVNGSVSTAAAIKARPAYTAGGGLNRGGFEFYTDAPSFVVNTAYTSANSFHVYVDDVFVGTQTQAGGERNYWTITFPARKVRKITLCQDTGNMNGFLGIYTANLDRVLPTKNTPDFKVVWNGDSYCEGALSGKWINSYFNIVSRALGFQNPWNVAMGGTGLLQKGPSGDRPNYRERIADIIAANPDLLIFNLTVNDSTQTPSALATEIKLYLQELRAALPEVWIIIHGVAAASLGPTQNVIDGEVACAAAIAEIGDIKTAFIPVTTDPAGPWIFGTGYKNAPNGTGNSDYYIGETGSSDFTHPNPDGYAYLSSRLIPAFKSQILKWSVTV